MIRSLLLTMALLLTPLPSDATQLPNQPVTTLALSRYQGQWHEIAHIPAFFQRRCTGPATAAYTPNPNGTLRVLTTCATSSGIKTVDGVAKYTPGRPGAFKVRFVPAWLGWVPKAWFDYWVIDIDPDYQWAVIGGPDSRHLWIMSRDRRMSGALYDRLVERARQRGYPVEKLVKMTPLN